VNQIYSEEDEARAFAWLVDALHRGFGVRHLVAYRVDETRQGLVPAGGRGHVEPAPGFIGLGRKGGQIESRVYHSDDLMLDEDGQGNSLLAFPLPSGIESLRLPVGVVTLHNFIALDRFAERREETQALTAFLGQAGRAIATVRQRQQLLLREQQRVQWLTGLSEVTKAVAAARDLEALRQLIVDNAQAVLQADLVTSYLYDANQQQFSAPVGVGMQDEAAFYGLPLPQVAGQIAGEIIRQRQPLIVEDVPAHPAAASVRFVQHEAVASAAGFPLLCEEEPLGVLFVCYRQPHHFSDAETQIIAVFAEHAAIAVENAHLHRQAQEANRNLEFSLQVLTHQLRAEPAFVTNTLDSLLQRRLGPLSDRQIDRLQKARRRLADHHRLIDNLNLYGRLKGDKIVPRAEVLDVNDLAQKVVDERQVEADRLGVRLLPCWGDLPPVQADGGLVGVILTNLVDNALKFTPAGGRICVETWSSPGRVHLAVDDTGIGIPEAERDRIFDEYHQVGSAIRREKGAGLGLYIARRLAGLQGGQVAVVDKAAPGARLEVWLPREE
jgi:signal transduction histidine kinase